MPNLDDDLLKELLATFHAEAADHLQTINQSLLRLERTPDDSLKATTLQNAFRAAHSLKGAARAVSLTNIEAVAHTMESVFQKARDDGLELGPDICDVLYDSLDVIERLLGGESIDVTSVQMRLSSLTDQEFDGALQPAGTRGGQSPAEVVPEAPVEETIRVAVGKIDDLMAQVGELLVAKISADQQLVEAREVSTRFDQWLKGWREIAAIAPRIEGDSALRLRESVEQHSVYTEHLFEAFDRLNHALNRDTARLSMVTTGLQDRVRKVRMVPFQSVIFTLERAVRDAARSENKEVRFTVEGSDVEIDKKVLEILKDPLLHLVRNSVAHGLESPEQREAVGKSAEGRVSLLVRQRGNEVHIAVADDGRGFDLQALREAHARRTGKPVDESVNDDEVMSFAFLPGITTSSEVTAISGRGVGLDVVQQSLGNIQGRVTIENVAGEGTTINMVVPVSLAMTRALLVRVGHERYAIPLLSIEKIVEPEGVFVVGGRQMLNVDNVPLPLLPLAQVIRRNIPENHQSAEPLALVMSVANQRLALLVDDVMTEQELAVKALGMPLASVLNVTGVAVLGNGEPIIILNPSDLVRSALGVQHVDLRVVRQEAPETEVKTHILVVDDSITTRTLEKNILEAAGYEVTTATDGTEALDRLAEYSTIQLVVADVEMPQMDGIVLTKTLRSMPEYRDMPLILVTSLESREDRERGMVAGANAYIVKRGFDQVELLATIENLL